MSKFNYTEAQEAWLQDLETTDAPQGCGYLEVLQDDPRAITQNKKVGFCCLGRGCIVAERHGVPVKRLYNALVGTTLNSHMEVFNWLGLRNTEGDPLDEHGYIHRELQSLTCMNDSGDSFKQIAQAIRANPEAYFVTPKPADQCPVQS